MLFDKKDLNVFEENESRGYFKEILQLYYIQNYRATIVMLYSFVIYDLFIKLQIMAKEGDTKAENKLNELNSMIADDEKYSKVENGVIDFYVKNSPLYFNRFIQDVNYLKDCRNKCAHLKVNDNSLFVPNDYHVRMLICSMYDNIFSVKAPFIMDLFKIANSDVENYSSSINYIPNDGLDDAVIKEIKIKYLKRMTYDSVKKSYRTFIKLLFITINDDTEKNIYGLYTFAFAITDYIVKERFIKIFSEPNILEVFSMIKAETIKNSALRQEALISIMTKFSVVMDLLMQNEELFNYISDVELSDPINIDMYRFFYPRNQKSIYTFFVENTSIHQPCFTDTLYNKLKDCSDFNCSEYMKIMANSIPKFNGYHDADVYMDSFLKHMHKLSIDDINDIMDIYNHNSQCKNRTRHSKDFAKIDKYIKDCENADSVDEQIMI